MRAGTKDEGPQPTDQSPFGVRPIGGFEAGASPVVHVDVCVVGGGSGGFGAAVAAARHGARVLLVEASEGLGGTSTWAGVNNWEPVAGPTGLPWELYERLRRRPLAVALQRRIRDHPTPGSWFEIAPEIDYRLSLSRRRGLPIAFEPQALDDEMAALLAEQERCEVWLRARVVEVRRAGRRIAAIAVERADGRRTEVRAGVYVDATADVYLARAAGCATHIGPDPRSRYGEAAAPDDEHPAPRLNNASLCYRVAPLAPGEDPRIQAPPPDVDLDAIRPATSIRTYPNGDLNLNPVGLMLGQEAYDLARRGGAGAAYDEARRRALAHWHLLQTRHGMAGWKLVWLSPALGVRESHRLVARYVLREQDCRAGLAAQEAGGLHDVVAIADHSLDFHGAGKWEGRELDSPYGIPFRCLLPQEVDNLLVACRGAGFSAVAASSCRLSRTMMTLGQAAGTAAALFGGEVADFDAAALRQALRADGVALTLEEGYLDAMAVIGPPAPSPATAKREARAASADKQGRASACR